MKLPEKLRNELKIPLGQLLPDNQVTIENISKFIKPNSFLITVGDATTERMISIGIIPSLQIIDSQEQRVNRKAPSDENIATKLSCKNPAGEISQESISNIKKAFSSKPPVRISVNGEEDLLVIPVCIFAPENSIVMYGQPNEGLVIVNINDKIRNKTQLLLDSMI